MIDEYRLLIAEVKTALLRKSQFNSANWVPACAGMTGEIPSTECTATIDWVPACAGMTGGVPSTECTATIDWIPAGMTGEVPSTECTATIPPWRFRVECANSESNSRRTGRRD